MSLIVVILMALVLLLFIVIVYLLSTPRIVYQFVPAPEHSGESGCLPLLLLLVLVGASLLMMGDLL